MGSMPVDTGRDEALGVSRAPFDSAAVIAAATLEPRILVVDDDDYIHVGVRAALRGLRGEIRSATTGAQALATAAAWHPDLAILDVGLPDTDGYQLAYDLRADPDLAEMRIIFLTGHLPDELAVQVIGGNLFLGKPYRMQVLAEAVQRQLDGPVARE
jgi:CheY-like chemotaxis protein